jgi:hypothetical protein
MSYYSPIMNFFIDLDNNCLIYKIINHIIIGFSKPKLPQNVLDAYFFIIVGSIMVLKFERLAKG